LTDLLLGFFPDVLECLGQLLGQALDGTDAKEVRGVARDEELILPV
jgi:hypothetical protein